MHCRFVVSRRVGDRGVDQLDVDRRVGRLDADDASGDRLCEGDIACALGPQNIEADDRRAVEASEGPRLRNRIGDDPQIVQPHFAARRQSNSRRSQIGNGLGPREGSDGLVMAADLSAAAGEVHVATAKLATHIERG